MPYLDGLNSQNPRFHQSYVGLDTRHAGKAMEPMWQQVDDPAASEAPDSGAGEASLTELNQPPSLDSEMMDALDLHKTNVNDKIHQLSRNGLIYARSMLYTEDRQDILLDMEEPLQFQEEDSMIDDSFLSAVDDKDKVLQFTDCLRGQHTSKEIFLSTVIESIACYWSTELFLLLHYGYFLWFLRRTSGHCWFYLRTKGYRN
jgi:hypothetical protein